MKHIDLFCNLREGRFVHTSTFYSFVSVPSNRQDDAFYLAKQRFKITGTIASLAPTFFTTKTFVY